MTAPRSVPRQRGLPPLAAPLGPALWRRSTARVRERHGIDIDAADAVDGARALAERSPEDPEAALLLASVLSTRGDDEAAEEQARRAVGLRDDLARAHTTLATILAHRGRPADALAEARRAAELAAEDPTVLYNLGLAEHAGGDARAAHRAFRLAWEALYATASADEPLPPPPWWWRRGRPRRGGRDG